jgi:hypothetical protein
MPAFPKICNLLINSSMRFVKNELLTPQPAAFTLWQHYASISNFCNNVKKAPF